MENQLCLKIVTLILVQVFVFLRFILSLWFFIKETSVIMHYHFSNFCVSENQLIIIGVYNSRLPSSYRRDVEALDENQILTCHIPGYAYPKRLYPLRGHSSTVTTTGILVCGGETGNHGAYLKECYEYVSSSNGWTRMPSMTEERYSFDMIFLRGKVYAVGGAGRGGSENSMEIFDPSTRTWKKELIRFSVSSHCITQLSANEFILIGGQDTSFGYREVSKNVMEKNISIQHFHFLHFTMQSIFYKLLF